MTVPPERSPERDRAIRTMLPFVPFTGWSMRTLTEAAGPDADLLFPGGAVDMIETHADLADREMAEASAAEDLFALRVPARVHRLVAIRLEQARNDKEAVARGLGVLSLPQNAAVAARTVSRTVDAIWRAAGDESEGFSWYSKRAILAPIYASTLLFWLRDYSDGDEASLAFLDRRLAGVGRIGRLRRQVTTLFPKPFRH